MPNNDFLPFATGAGANVVAQAQFVADPSTAAGFAAGIAVSGKLNKVWRQSSFVSSALAGLIADELDIDIFDDGNLDAFKSYLRAALLSLNPRQVMPIGGTQFWVNQAIGSDAHNGTSPTTAWATLQHAADVMAESIDGNLQTITINIADGVYPGFALQTAVLGIAHPGNLRFIGNLANPSAVIIQSAPVPSSTIPINCCIEVQNGAMLLIEGVRFLNPTGSAIAVSHYGRVRYGFCDFAACAGDHVYAAYHSHARLWDNCTISGGATNHLHVRSNSTWLSAGPVNYNLIGTPHFTNFLALGANSVCQFNDPDGGPPGLTFTGAATGRRWHVHGGGVAHTNVGDPATPTFLPGDVAGFTDATTFGVFNSADGSG